MEMMEEKYYTIIEDANIVNDYCSACDAELEHRGWYNFYDCPHCGARIIDIDNRVDMTES